MSPARAHEAARAAPVDEGRLLRTRKAVDCQACLEARTQPIDAAGEYISHDPAVVAGDAEINGQRLRAEMIADRIRELGIAESMESYGLTREQCLVACWWAGVYSQRRALRKWFEDWAFLAGRHLWHSCIQVPDPPTLKQAG